MMAMGQIHPKAEIRRIPLATRSGGPDHASRRNRKDRVFPEDDEELALTLDGSKKRINKQNFIRAMASSGLSDKVTENIFHKFANVAQKWHDFIDISFLPDNLKEKYKEEIAVNLDKLQG